MRLAVEKPKTFCRLLVAAFLRPPRKRCYSPVGGGSVGTGTDILRRAIPNVCPTQLGVENCIFCALLLGQTPHCEGHR